MHIQVVKALIEVSRMSSWAEVVHSKLISILARMFYDLPDEQGISSPCTPKFLVEQVDMIGGIDFIFMEVYCHLYRTVIPYVCLSKPSKNTFPTFVCWSTS